MPPQPAVADRGPAEPTKPQPRTWIAQVALAAVVWVVWGAWMQSQGLWHLFSTKWYMSLTMAVGSFIAGATSEGGGAVAFPVMTLLFKIPPTVARDFSLMIQSVGMVAAAALIIVARIPVEWRAIKYSGLGGVFGIVFGLEVISPLLSPPFTKTFFVALWLSFALGLYWMNRDRDREVYGRIPGFSRNHGILLFIVGLVGGTVSGIAGSGLDIVTFSVLVLVFSVHEGIATPTSVVLMATNTVVGFLWREGFGGGVADAAWEYWYVCIPIVVVGAPLGARFIRNRSRMFVVAILYVSIGLQYVGALLILEQSPALLAFNVVVVAIGSFLFWRLALVGRARAAELARAKAGLPLAA